MICELHLSSNILMIWLLVAVLGLISMMLFSGSVFLCTHQYATYETWKRKTIARYPEPDRVAAEILQTGLGMFVASIPAAAGLWLAQHGFSQAYCGLGRYGAGYDVVQALVIWIGSDFWEFFYHWCGHQFSDMWDHHKYHHTFANPTPFAVIADGFLDNIMRALPLLVFPVVMPTNMDILVFIYALFFYAYGVYLHCGHEFDWPNAQTPFLNSSYYHTAHHAYSIKNKPLHTGFFLRCWDELFGSVIPPHEIVCAKTARESGKRTREQWREVHVPDYSVLLKVGFWAEYLRGNKAK